MTYVVQRRNRWYTVAYEGIDPITGRGRRQWRPALDEAGRAMQLPSSRARHLGARAAGSASRSLDT